MWSGLSVLSASVRGPNVFKKCSTSVRLLERHFLLVGLEPSKGFRVVHDPGTH
uniref:Uncharacterized protein n=1 Tax=Arundo donax TaxID=35708 RepID=A0A0A8XRF6_ARUDO